MGLSKSRIKYLNALKIKKYRQLHRQFVMEGDKMVGDLLRDKHTRIRQLVATEEWLAGFDHQALSLADEVVAAGNMVLERITSLETPPPAIALLDIREAAADAALLRETLSVALDTIQDPGNLGTIIRTADWFGITQLVCSEGCADCYNPKAIQSSMGAILRVNVTYTDLAGMTGTLTSDGKFPLLGACMDGDPVYSLPPLSRGMLLFGNESRGISFDLEKYLTQRVTIPPGNGRSHVESLNVASAVAVVCAMISKH